MSSAIKNFTVSDDLTASTSGCASIYGNASKGCSVDKSHSGASSISISRV